VRKYSQVLPYPPSGACKWNHGPKMIRQETSALRTVARAIVLRGVVNRESAEGAPGVCVDSVIGGSGLM